MSLYLYLYPNGERFGPASEEMAKAWQERKAPYIEYPYHGYSLKVTVGKETENRTDRNR